MGEFGMVEREGARTTLLWLVHESCGSLASANSKTAFNPKICAPRRLLNLASCSPIHPRFGTEALLSHLRRVPAIAALSTAGETIQTLSQDKTGANKKAEMRRGLCRQRRGVEYSSGGNGDDAFEDVKVGRCGAEGMVCSEGGLTEGRPCMRAVLGPVLVESTFLSD